MATQEDVRRVALSLPETREEQGRFAFAVRRGAKFKSFCWAWNERVEAKKPRVPNPTVLAVRVADEMDKFGLIELASDRFFTEPHYNGFPAVLVRLDAVDPDELRNIIVAGWRLQAPKSLLKAHAEPL